MKQLLDQAEQELTRKIDNDIVTKKSFKIFSVYRQFMRTAKTTDKYILPAELQAQAQQLKA